MIKPVDFAVDLGVPDQTTPNKTIKRGLENIWQTAAIATEWPQRQDIHDTGQLW